MIISNEHNKAKNINRPLLPNKKNLIRFEFKNTRNTNAGLLKTNNINGVNETTEHE